MEVFIILVVIIAMYFYKFRDEYFSSFKKIKQASASALTEASSTPVLDTDVVYMPAKKAPPATINYMSIPTILSEDLLQSWSCYLPDLSVKREQFFEKVIVTLAEKKTKQYICRTTIGGLFKNQPFLVIPFIGCYCLFGADIMGTDLVVSWNLCDPRGKTIKKRSENPFVYFFQRIFTKRSEIINDIRLKTFASVTEDVANQAVDRLVEDTTIDRKKLNRKSSGRLGPL